MMGVHVANRTERIRIGMAVSLAAFYHPLRLAEEVALLDVLSGGRVNWGAGRGFDPIEFRAFGVPVEESAARFREAVDIVLRAWTCERLDWSGRHWCFEDVEVLPKPLQRPHPPTWVAAGSPSALRWAGREGHSVLLGPHATFEESAAFLRLYNEQLNAHGHTAAGRDLPLARMVAVADTDEEAASIARSGTQWVAGAYINPSKVTNPDSPAQDFLAMDRDALLDRYLSSVVIHGTPDRVCEQIDRLRAELCLNYLLIVPLSHASFVTFTKCVLPDFS
jgi:alkanesulfonate monooxygenase SsuD/methylene tetrahydromethanopterin reductase-like flavin-dependent oxidoreductase (luciferase family)